MIRWLLPPLVLLSACSAPRHQDQWRYDAADATLAYREHFLHDNALMRADAYRRALRASQQSADLLPMARLYLTRCALNKAVLIDDPCDAYADVSPLIDSAELDAYYAMLTGTLDTDRIEQLPEQYRPFARAVAAQDAAAVRTALRTLAPPTSRMIAASTVLDTLDEALVETIVHDASEHGYRRAVIAWMHHLLLITNDPKKKKRLEKKLELISAASPG